MPSRLLILISGRGSNMLALADAVARGAIDATVAGVLADRPDAAGLDAARQRGLRAETVARDADFDRRLLDAARAFAPDLIALAGFMRILKPDFVRHFDGRILNVHPALLPRHPGLDTHRRALAAGDREHGCSVHFVDEGLDTGPLVMQARVAVRDGDTPEGLAARVLKREHVIFPHSVGLFCAGRLRLDADGVLLDGAPLASPLLLDEGDAGDDANPAPSRAAAPRPAPQAS